MMMLLRPPPTLRNIFLTSKFLVTNFLTIKTQPGTASKAKAGARLLIANHLDQSNYLVKSETEPERAVNKYDLTLLIRLSQGSERCAFSQCPSKSFH
jgi:hypothetical protein